MRVDGISSIGGDLVGYLVGQAMRASRAEVQTAVATKVLKTAREAQQSVLALLDSAARPITPASPTLTAQVSGCGCNLDTYA